MLNFNNIHHKEAFDLICKALETDLDENVCMELALHLQACPDCRVYFDSVRKTVKLYQKIIKDQSVPPEVQERLYSVLHLRK